MKFTAKITLLILFCSSIAFSQELSREQKLQKIDKLNNQIKMLEADVLLPDINDLKMAEKEGFEVFRLMPREKYERKLTINGGGAYYSFYFRIPDYGHGSDIGLEQNYIQTGIGGCGFMADLGEVSLNDVTKETSSVAGLVDYQNTKDRNLCVQDYYRARETEGLNLNGNIFRTRLSPVVGHTYLTRSASEDYYDVLVAFQVRRKDADGSLIIFWKMLEQFETPQRNNLQKAQPSDEKILLETKGWSRTELFPNVKVEVTDGIMTLRGQIPKDKLAYAVQLANSAGARKVINLLDIK